ncbi:MAG: glycosyltransferase [Promethearchaeota archaeon]
MNIALYTGMFKRNQDGVARCLHRLVHTMADQGHHVFIGSPALSYIDHPNLTFFKVKSFPLFFYTQYEVAVPDMKYIQTILEYKPDIIHISTPDFMGMVLYFFAKRFRIPVVFIHHSDINRVFNYFGLGFSHSIINSLLKVLYNGSVATYCPSQIYKKELIDMGVKRVGIWSRGVDHSDFNADYRDSDLRTSWGAPEKKIILYAGRLVWNKRLDIVISMYQKFQRMDKNPAQFVIVGEGIIEEELKEKMPEAIFTGFLEGRELGKALASGDIFIFPSDTDTFGQVVQEAITSGLPSVVSDVGGCQEIVNTSGAGYVIKNGDVNGYYNACLKLLQNDSLRENLSKKGIKYGKTRDWDSINRELISQYQKIMQFWKYKKAYVRFKNLSDVYRPKIFDEIEKRLKKMGLKGEPPSS